MTRSPMGAPRPNRFFIWRRHAREAIEYQPEKLIQTETRATDVRYFVRLAIELDRALANRSLTFLTTWELDAFDERFRDAVVILIGDEMYKTPTNAPAVRIVFKTGGTRRNPLAAVAKLPTALAWRLLLRELRNSLVTLRRDGLSSPHRVRMHGIPIGYFGLTDVPFVPFDERRIDIFFAGSIESARGISVRPRSVARRHMAAALATMRIRLPELTVQIGLFENSGERLAPNAYSNHLMNTKIALCPRGNFDETYRIVEAARFGCVAISEPLPPRWYNRDSPVVQIKRWDSLSDVVASLTADPQALVERSRRMIAWWKTRLSEQAVAAYIARELTRPALVTRRYEAESIAQLPSRRADGP